MARATARVVVLAAVAVGAVAWAPGPVGGQVAPTLAVVPSDPVAPGEVVQLVLDGCTVTADAPTVHLLEQDQDAVGTEVMDPAGTGSWTLDLEVGDVDIDVLGVDGCVEGDPEPPDLVIDVENPLLLRIDIEYPSYVTGTDCPDGGEPEAVLVQDGVEVALDPSAPDAQGDWTAEIIDDSFVAGTAEVRATCGDVTYAPLSISVEGGSSSSTSTTTTAPSGESAAAAEAVTTEADLTG